jgi:hypothetical protein
MHIGCDLQHKSQPSRQGITGSPGVNAPLGAYTAANSTQLWQQGCFGPFPPTPLSLIAKLTQSDTRTRSFLPHDPQQLLGAANAVLAVFAVVAVEVPERAARLACSTGTTGLIRFWGQTSRPGALRTAGALLASGRGPVGTAGLHSCSQQQPRQSQARQKLSAGSGCSAM